MSSATSRKRRDKRTTSKSRRRRNPTVASYLGLGTSTEPAHLSKYAPTPNDHSSPTQAVRKRKVTRSGEKMSKKMNTSTEKSPTQESIRDTEIETKSFSQSVIHELDGSGKELLLTPASTAAKHQVARQVKATANIAMSNSNPPQLEMPGTHDSVFDNDDDDFGQLCFDFEPKAPLTTEPACWTPHLELTQLATGDDEFDDDLEDDDLLDLSSSMMDHSSCSDLHPTLSIKTVPLQSTQTSGLSVDTADTPEERVISSNIPQYTFKSPVTLTTRLLAANGDEVRKPFARQPFPKATRDRSPIIGMSSNTLLRTCFRVGEAINQSCQAGKTGSNILIELYARVLRSERDDMQQCFTFCDLFHANPPYIQATYAAAIWKSVRLFEYDSARLLQQGRICRCIGTMKRNGKDWMMTVLNIWEATWDDVEWVKGIIQS